MPKNYANGLYWNESHPNAPSWIAGKLAIKKEQFIDWLQQQDANDYGYVKLEVTERKDRDDKGRKQFSIAVDDWKPSNSQGRGPERAESPDGFEDDIPFAWALPVPLLPILMEVGNAAQTVF